MDVEMIKDWFTLENVMRLIEEYRSLFPFYTISDGKYCCGSFEN
jgi:hypothetical protein